jgi:hypothetical protein
LRRGGSSKEEDAPAPPDTLAIDAQGRRPKGVRSGIASGDIALLLDAVIRKLGQGLDAGPGGKAARSEEEEIGQDDEPSNAPPTPPPDLHQLAASCRRKVNTMMNRLSKQMDSAHASGNSARAIVQLATVLGLVRALRSIERRQEWRRAGEHLVASKRLQQFLRDDVPVLTLGEQALLSSAIAECEGEPFNELSLAVGLVLWLAWECDVAITTASSVEEESTAAAEERWAWVQRLGYLAPWVTADEAARDIARESVLGTPRRDSDPDRWLETHLSFLQALGTVMLEPETAELDESSPAAGDVVVLPEGFEPRVRLVLRLHTSGDRAQVVLLDEDKQDGRRSFIANRIRRVLLEPMEEAHSA